MLRLAKSVFKILSMLLLGALLGLALLSWYLNHSQCRGLIWSGELGAPLIMLADDVNCMRTAASGDFEGVWAVGREMNYFFPINSETGKVILPKEPFALDISEASHFLIREKLNLDSNIYEPSYYKIEFLGNRMVNYYKGHSGYRNFYNVKEIERVSVFEGEIPSWK